MANVIPSQELTSQAKYGRRPFDIYLVEHWDHTVDATEDQRQWEMLARQYLSLTPRGRHRYQVESEERLASEYDAAAASGSAAVIFTRILPLFQTVQERNFCGRWNDSPALLRTYYGDDSEQDDAHNLIVENALLNGLVDNNGVFNDKTLYNFGNNWQRLLLRIPELCNQERGVDEESYGDGARAEDVEQPPPPGDDDASEQWLSSRVLYSKLYVRDREAIESGHIKVYYINTHGDAIWHHKLRPGILLEFDGACRSMNLADINSGFSLSRENGCELFI